MVSPLNVKELKDLLSRKENPCFLEASFISWRTYQWRAN